MSELEDERGIREMLANYGFNADLGREQEWVDLWTAHGTYDLDGGASFTGPDELLSIVKDPNGVHKQEIEDRGQHVAIDPVDSSVCELSATPRHRWSVDFII